MQTSNRRDVAIAWRVRLSGPAADAAEWAAFTQWLEADAANAQAYDEIALADADLSDMVALSPLPRNAGSAPATPWRRRRTVWAIAAGVVLAALALPMLLPQRQLMTIQTRPGELREVVLAGGSLIALNGGTRMALDQRSERYVRLDAGEALFRIRHDPARPFVVEVAHSTLQDIGTVFNVREANGALEVAVTEGAVVFNPNLQAVTVQAGERLLLPQPQAAAVVSRADSTTVAGWRTGRLSYQDALLRDIAIDLSRSLGVRIDLAPALGTRRFTGTLRLEADQVVFFRRLEALLSVHARQTETGWDLTP